MSLCKCGCGKEVKKDNKYINGHNRAYKGKHHSDESKKKISENNRGQPCSEETKRKISIANKGRKAPNYGKNASEESKKKMSESHKGYKPSEKTKEKMSNIMYQQTKNLTKEEKGKKFGSFGKNNPMFGKPSPKGAGHSKGAYYDSPLQGTIWLRSSYEIAYAKYLDKNKILWMYEMETFDLGDTTYTPDFFLPKFEKFIDTKGYMTPEAQEKINMFLEQYPWDLEILYKKDLKDLGVEL